MSLALATVPATLLAPSAHWSAFTASLRAFSSSLPMCLTCAARALRGFIALSRGPREPGGVYPAAGAAPAAARRGGGGGGPARAQIGAAGRRGCATARPLPGLAGSRQNPLTDSTQECATARPLPGLAGGARLRAQAAARASGSRAKPCAGSGGPRRPRRAGWRRLAARPAAGPPRPAGRLAGRLVRAAGRRYFRAGALAR